jgi:hypothetical protein
MAAEKMVVAAESDGCIFNEKVINSPQKIEESCGIWLSVYDSTRVGSRGEMDVDLVEETLMACSICNISIAQQQTGREKAAAVPKK